MDIGLEEYFEKEENLITTLEERVKVLLEIGPDKDQTVITLAANVAILEHMIINLLAIHEKDGFDNSFKLFNETFSYLKTKLSNKLDV